MTEAPLTKTERTTISLSQQIEEVERELEFRATVYPRMMAKGNLKPSHAEYHTQRMRAVLQTLQWMKANETEIREIMAQRFAERDRKK